MGGPQAGIGAPRFPRIVAVGASAGGVEALTELCAGLPSDLPAPVLVVLHLPPRTASVLPEILGRAGPLRARHAVAGAPLEAGVVTVAPPDRHLEVIDSRTVLLDGPRENGVRPAIDPLFRSVARSAGARSVGVVLSGMLDDGSSGLLEICAAGGVGVAQDPREAFSDGMPSSAIELDAVDHVLPAAAIGPLLATLCATPVRPAVAKDGDEGRTLEEDAMAEPVPITCPECGGPMEGFQRGASTTFRCLVGHAFSPGTLAEGTEGRLEQALWAALRTLEESSGMSSRLETRARTHGAQAAAARFAERQTRLEEQAELIRDALRLMDADRSGRAGPSTGSRRRRGPASRSGRRARGETTAS